MSFWEQVTALFRSAERSSPTAPTVHELIERSAAERTAYDRWMRTESRHRLLDWVGQAYAGHLSGKHHDQAIGFLDLPSSQGFVIYLQETGYRREEIVHFFDFLRDRILELGYRPEISDRRMFPRDHWVETQERHYLKPRGTADALERQPQRFGNLTLELELRDDRPHNLRLRATHYVDANYLEAEGFGGLMEGLLGKE